MAKVRCVLRHVKVEVAGGTRRCRRNRSHAVVRGEPCLVIQDDGTPFAKSYCSKCALPILKQCAADLRAIRDNLYGGPVVAGSESKHETLGATLVKANKRRIGKAPSSPSKTGSAGESDHQSCASQRHGRQVALL